MRSFFLFGTYEFKYCYEMFIFKYFKVQQYKTNENSSIASLTLLDYMNYRRNRLTPVKSYNKEIKL